MALFGSKKEQKTKDTAVKEQKEVRKDAVATPAISSGRMYEVLKGIRVTEKATFQTDDSVYVFNVDPSATKKEIAAAIKTFYKVVPKAIKTVRIPRKYITRRGRKGVKGGGKKAYIYLAKGDTIEIA